MAVGYGWGWFGPARVAQGGPTQRRQEYVESMVARGVLAPPVSLIAAIVACSISSNAPSFAAVGAVSATCMGLSASWYFVGMSKPYTMLLLDTLPRAAGTAFGILLMREGHSAVMGPLGMLVGMSVGVALSSAWILWETKRAGAGGCERHGITGILVANRQGIASALGSATYAAAPLAIVSVVAPGIQPAFALADRVKGLVVVATVPATTVLQGWVPRATGIARRRRADAALLSAAAFALLLGVGTFLAAPDLIKWLGAGAISLSWDVILLMSACVAVMFFQSVLERVALATFERLRVAVIGVACGSIIGLPLAGVLAHKLGTAGAMGGVLAGLLVCVTVELVTYRLDVGRTVLLRAGDKKGQPVHDDDKKRPHIQTLGVSNSTQEPEGYSRRL
ncbi:hypothetical protein [Mycolicibacterium chubuense]|uniref:hypothetical protein n=1 Tax=Mycolicibacterium chubuense TaxID=1800 RepID=UPI001039856E|nr:hypothetical protein [Mycolicibacterium chubuense]